MTWRCGGPAASEVCVRRSFHAISKARRSPSRCVSNRAQPSRPLRRWARSHVKIHRRHGCLHRRGCQHRLSRRCQPQARRRSLQRSVPRSLRRIRTRSLRSPSSMWHLMWHPETAASKPRQLFSHPSVRSRRTPSSPWPNTTSQRRCHRTATSMPTAHEHVRLQHVSRRARTSLRRSDALRLSRRAASRLGRRHRRHRLSLPCSRRSLRHATLMP